jgi:hypothetical protein
MGDLAAWLSAVHKTWSSLVPWRSTASTRWRASSTSTLRTSTHLSTYGKTFSTLFWFVGRTETSVTQFLQVKLTGAHAGWLSAPRKISPKAIN